MQTIKVKPWGEDQGDFVIINKDDFDEDVHELLEGEELKKATVAELRAALEAKGIKAPEGAKKADLQALLSEKS